ncbi:MAG: hypothetical protein ACTSRC_22485 [Candidatus Helarchaeota archaeon]
MCDKAMKNKCPLCDKIGEIRNSHLIPAAFYRIIARNSEPVVIDGKVQRISNRQIKKELLCSNCELKLSENGEMYVSRNCLRENKFVFRDILFNMKPVMEKGGYKIYNISMNSEIDIQKILYFAISVFWRAAVIRWNIGNNERVKIHLGSYYESQLKSYLMGEIEFPKYTTLHLFIDCEDKYRFITIPYKIGKKNMVNMYGFSVPGMMFILAIGRSIPEVLRTGCLYHYKTITLADILHSKLSTDIFNLFSKSRVSKKLKKYLK